MATQVVGTDIRDEVKRRADLPTFSSNTFISSTDVANMIVDSAADLSGLLRKALGDDYFTRVTTLTTSGSPAGSVSLTSISPAMFNLRRIHWERSATDIVPLERATPDDWDAYTANAQSWSSDTPKYTLMGDAIYLFPTANTTYTLRVYYDAGIAITTALSETVSMWPGWKEWIVLDVLHKIRQRENKHDLANNHLQERDRVYASIIQPSQGRDEWRPQQVRDLANNRGNMQLTNGYWRNWR